MTPRALVNGFPADAKLTEIQAELMNANHSQFPVFEDDLDRVVGVLWLKEALRALVLGEADKCVADVQRPAQFVPPTRTVDDVFHDLQESGRRMLVVIDEYGATMGLITMDDLVEELVGEAIDATDLREGHVKRLSRTEAIVHGLTRVRDVARFLKCDVAYEDPEDETSTVSGLLQDRLERIPARGDQIELPGGLQLEVHEADARMATRVLARNTKRTLEAGTKSTES
jgi:CBS domain containing-hemolysin-like protein